MKRLPTLLLCVFAVALAAGLVACGSGSSSSSGASGSASAETSSASAASTEAASSGASSETPGDTAASASATASAASGVSEASTMSESAEVASPSAQASAGEVGSSQAAPTDSAAESAGFDFVDECTDEHGNVTLYALTELKGWQLATLLDQQKYEWNASETMWARPMDGASFAALKETGPYTIDTYNEMNEKGGGIAAIGLHVVAGYADMQAALKGNAKCVVEDSYFNDNGGIAIFYGPSMKEYLAIISPYTESTTLFMVFSKEAVGSGMADQYLGRVVGGSFQEVWKSVTGRDTYGH